MTEPIPTPAQLAAMPPSIAKHGPPFPAQVSVAGNGNETLVMVDTHGRMWLRRHLVSDRHKPEWERIPMPWEESP